MLDAYNTPSTVLSLSQQVAIHLIDDVPDRFLPDLQVGRLGADPGRVHDGSHVDAGAFVEEPPEEARNEGEKRLKYEDQRHPLVITDHNLIFLMSKFFSRNDFGHRQIVGVADPAHRVRIVSVTVGELSRAPAGDGTPDELLRADKEPEADEYDDGVLAAESVHIIVVHPELDLTDSEHGLE